MDRHISISAALNCIRTASEEELRVYSNDILQILDRLCDLHFVRRRPRPNHHCESDFETGNLRSVLADSNARSIHRENERSSTSAIGSSTSVFENYVKYAENAEVFVKMIKKRLKSTAKFLSQTKAVAVGEPVWDNEDPRILDVLASDGDQSDRARFLRVLSQRDLAIEYDQWERSNYGSSRIETLFRNPSLSGVSGY